MKRFGVCLLILCSFLRGYAISVDRVEGDEERDRNEAFLAVVKDIFLMNVEMHGRQKNVIEKGNKRYETWSERGQQQVLNNVALPLAPPGEELPGFEGVFDGITSLSVGRLYFQGEWVQCMLLFTQKGNALRQIGNFQLNEENPYQKTALIIFADQLISSNEYHLVADYVFHYPSVAGH